VEARPAPYPDYKLQPSAPTTVYRVTIWEQPDVAGIDPESVGWAETTFDLVDVQDVREAIEWAERRVIEGAGYSGSGRPVRDREYVLYAKAPRSDQWIQIAGWDPTKAGENLSRFRGRS
jgi:hypothetical protein